MNDIKISCNWTFEDSDLNKVVTCCLNESKEYGIDNVTADSCLCLIQPKNDNQNKPLTIEVKTKGDIQDINILSEGRLIEVFGNYNEYLFSCPGKFIDDWNGMAVFHAKIILPRISSCKLKFTRTKEKSRIWIYGIQVAVFQHFESPKEIFNFDNVNKLISDSSQQISEKAEKFKNFLEVYMKNSSQVKPFNIGGSFDFQVLCSLLNESQGLNVETLKKSWCKQRVNGEEEKLNGAVKSFSVENELSEHFKSYIDEKFVKMKREILEAIDVKLNSIMKQNDAKLNEIKELMISREIKSCEKNFIGK